MCVREKRRGEIGRRQRNEGVRRGKRGRRRRGIPVSGRACPLVCSEVIGLV